MTNDESRTVVITGAGGGQGIALATARRFFAQGHTVALTDVNPAVLEVPAREFDGSDRVLATVMDVADEESVKRAVEQVCDRTGRVDILINNASLFTELPLVGWDEVDLATWDRVMAVNLRGPFVCSRQVLPGMIDNGWGRIVNIGSSTSITGSPWRLHYAASKGGIVSLTRSLARAVGNDGVTVNCVAPGATRTEAVLKSYSEEILESGLAGRSIMRPEVPDDLAGAVTFLASEQAGFVTGQTLLVDGGSAFL